MTAFTDAPETDVCISTAKLLIECAVVKPIHAEVVLFQFFKSNMIMLRTSFRTPWR
jgi:hypothetical protein